MCNIFHGFELMFVAYFNVNYYWTIPLLFGYHVKEGIMFINVCIIFFTICRSYIVVESTYYERDMRVLCIKQLMIMLRRLIQWSIKLRTRGGSLLWPPWSQGHPDFKTIIIIYKIYNFFILKKNLWPS